MKKESQKYVPRELSAKDKKKQRDALAESREAYKEGEYVDRPKLKSYKSKPSGHVARAKAMYSVDHVSASDELARKSGCPKRALEKILSKGRGAYYSSGSRPNQTSGSWSSARLASALTGGKAAAVDYDILKCICRPGSRALKLATEARKKYGYSVKTKPCKK